MEANLGDPHDGSVALSYKFVKTRQLVTRQPESILDNLLVQVALDFENDFADCHSCSPAIEAALSLAHTAFVSTCVDANVGSNAHVQPELHASQPLFDGFFSDTELMGTDAAVVVAHTKTVVAPYDSGAAHTATSGHSTSAFA